MSNGNYLCFKNVLSFHLYRYTLDVEAVSCDELYLNCTKILETTNASPIELATFIRNEIKVIILLNMEIYILCIIILQEITKCPCSIGIGSNCLQARLATKKAKPDGQYYLEPSTIMDFMKNIDVCDVPGSKKKNTCHG